MQALEQQGVSYEIRGSSIYVAAEQRDQLRLTLASQGLPMASGQGYELLDNLSGFGTTAQMFDAAYWRAKEGELARTIQSNAFISQARVHIANTRDRPFQDAAALTAAVTAVGTSGAVGSEHAQAMRYLVSSAVAGLEPKNVSVIDGRTGDVVLAAGETASDHRNSNRAAELRQNVMRLLEARVGPGRAIVEVNIDLDTDTEKVVERIFDPNGRVQISSQTEETSANATNQGSSSVTVASNLPEGEAGGARDSSSDQTNTTREIANFEVSETQREISIAPGKVRRVTTAVMVDGIIVPDPNGGEPTWQPRSDDELATLKDLVASVVGFDEARGDVLTIKSLELAVQDMVLEPTQSSLIQSLGLDVMRIVQLAIVGMVAIILGLFVLRPMINRQDVSGQSSQPASQLAAPAYPSELPPKAPETVSAPGISAPGQSGNLLAPPAAKDPEPIAEDPVLRLRKLVEERQDEALEILNNWMTEQEERA
jgi:flagellar M-ring protein FliF